MMHDFISLGDLTSDDILELLELAEGLKLRRDTGRDRRPLEGQTLAMIFEKPSLRTRVTFETGIFQLGGHGIVLDMEQSRLGVRESVPDVARNLERWVDGIVARTFSHQAVVDLANHACIPVINALTDYSHPCQVLADALALREHKGAFENLKLAFVGDGNNVCTSWLLFASRIPIRLAIVCPEDYLPDPEVLAMAMELGKGEVTVSHDPATGVSGADAVYTDVWASMGQESESASRKKIFQPYQVDAALMAMAKPDAVFMHCLPAHRGEEVTDEVMDSPSSIVFDQAENRLHAQKAVMLKLMEKDKDGLCPKKRARLEK